VAWLGRIRASLWWRAMAGINRGQRAAGDGSIGVGLICVNGGLNAAA